MIRQSSSENRGLLLYPSKVPSSSPKIATTPVATSATTPYQDDAHKMVATRNHPEPFQEPPVTESPTKRVTRAAAAANNNNSTSTSTSITHATTHATPSKTSSPPLPTSPPSTRTRAASRTRAAAAATAGAWSHTPSNLTLLWLAVSLPLVIWDTGFVLLRPFSLPGGKLHAPIWSPYDLYGRVDHVYGPQAWKDGYGWTAAQGSLNLLETSAYLAYLYVVYVHGRADEGQQGRGAPEKENLPEGGGGILRTLAESRTVSGRWAGVATLLCYSTASITFWKTVLYWLIEAFSGFQGIGHNDWLTLVFLWIIPNGLWLIFPSYMMYVFGAEILEGLVVATEGNKKSR